MIEDLLGSATKSFMNFRADKLYGKLKKNIITTVNPNYILLSFSMFYRTYNDQN